MENEQRPQSHKEREAQTLVDRIEMKEASQEAAREKPKRERSTTTGKQSNERFRGRIYS
jgi:hypothetical protein